jgi:hypothetical protein
VHDRLNLAKNPLRQYLGTVAIGLLLGTPFSDAVGRLEGFV